MRLCEVFPNFYTDLFDEKLETDISQPDKRGILEAIASEKTTVETFLWEIIKLLKGIAIALQAPEIKEPAPTPPKKYFKSHYNKEDYY